MSESAGQGGRDGRRARGLRRELVAALRVGGEIRTEAVGEAFGAVPRHLFVPEVSVALAYADTVVPTKFDAAGGAISALSQPAIVAVMLEQLDVRPGMRVLEIGAGTGYNAALLEELVGGRSGEGVGGEAGGGGRVVTVDVDEDIVVAARGHLAAAGGGARVRVVLGDGALGYAEGAPYDRIIATVGAADVPAEWLAQLADGGRVVLPLRIKGGVTRSVVIEREEDGTWWRGTDLEVCSFMPLRGIADDLGRTVQLTADGLVEVAVYAEQRVGEGLGRALDTAGTERSTGVRFEAGESFSELDLYLTCALRNGMSRISAAGAAVESGLVRPQFTWGGMCAVDGDSLAYVTLSQSSDDDILAGRYEVGVVGHGPEGAALADEVAARTREWDAELRGLTAVLRIAQGEGRERLTGRCVVDKEVSRIAVDWG